MTPLQSDWSPMGLKGIIPSLLHHTLLGYNFLIPDAVGNTTGYQPLFSLLLMGPNILKWQHTPPSVLCQFQNNLAVAGCFNFLSKLFFPLITFLWIPLHNVHVAHMLSMDFTQSIM